MTASHPFPLLLRVAETSRQSDGQRQLWSTTRQHPQCLPVMVYFAVPYVAPALVDEYIMPAPSMDAAPAPVGEYISPAPVGYAAPALVDEYIAPAPATHAVYAASAPVVEDTGPASAVSSLDPSGTSLRCWSKRTALSWVQECTAPVTHCVKISVRVGWGVMRSGSCVAMIRGLRQALTRIGCLQALVSV